MIVSAQEALSIVITKYKQDKTPVITKYKQDKTPQAKSVLDGARTHYKATIRSHNSHEDSKCDIRIHQILSE